MGVRIEELLNRKPSKWSNVTVKEFERDIKHLQEQAKRSKELEEQQNSVKWYWDELERLERENEELRSELFKITRGFIENHKWYRDK